jgi:hypothetical protein
MRSHKLIGRAAVHEAVHETKVFVEPMTHEILPFVCDGAEPLAVAFQAAVRATSGFHGECGVP